jgi:hypothetical protein
MVWFAFRKINLRMAELGGRKISFGPGLAVGSGITTVPEQVDAFTFFAPAGIDAVPIGCSVAAPRRRVPQSLNGPGGPSGRFSRNLPGGNFLCGPKRRPCEFQPEFRNFFHF